MPKVIFANVNKGFEKGIIPLGILSVATYLKKYNKNLEITILDSNCQDIYKDFRRSDIVGISSVTQTLGEAVKFARFVRSKSDALLVLGGVHISTFPVLPEPFDVGVMGEGEQTMHELVNSNDFSKDTLKKIKGVCFNCDEGLHITEPRQSIMPLDSLPMPERDMMNMRYYLKKRQIIPYYSGRSLTMMTSRGCPFNCPFCSTKIHWNRFRAFSAERVVAEMDLLVERYQAEIIHIFDDLFIADKKRLQEIHRLVVKKELNKKVKFMCLVRSDMLDEQTMKIIKEMNVVVMGIGMESGSERVLSYLKNNTISVEDNRRAIELADKYKIPAMGSFMIGNPNETKEEMLQSLNFIKKYRCSPFMTPLVYIATPFPGTEFWSFAKNLGVNMERFDFFAMDIPKKIKRLRKSLLLTSIPVEEFFKLSWLFIKENRYGLVKKEIFMGKSFFNIFIAYLMAIFIEKDIIKGIREVNNMRRGFLNKQCS